MSQTDYDVIVVGGGPAGASASYDLAAAGFSVVVLDRHAFPRIKACAGGLTQKTLRTLRYSVAPVIQRECAALWVSRGSGPGKRFEGRDTLCALTVRKELDAFCMRQSLEQGAAFAQIRQLHEIGTTPTGVRAATDVGEFTARYLIGADGANSRVNGLGRLFPGVARSLALEACVPWNEGQSPLLTLDFFAVEGGYGWVFPKRDHLNIGLFTRRPEVKITKEQLLHYAATKVGARPLEDLIGQHLGLNGKAYRPRAGRLFLAGDAAGLTDPLFGEGIYNAVRSGQLVAEAIRRHGDDPAAVAAEYDRLLGEIRLDLQRCERSAWWVRTCPAFYSAIWTAPLVSDLLMKGFEKGMTWGETTSRLWLLPFLSRRKTRPREGLRPG